MKELRILGLAVLAVGLASCGEDSTTTPPPPVFQQPAGTVAVSFAVDDTANKVYKTGQLQWKGEMKYESSTRKVTKDSTWGGPFAPLYDDGPWNAGGHEGPGSVANDNIWGITVFATPPVAGSDTYSYGLINVPYETTYGDGWIWTGSNGSVAVAAGSVAPITAPGTSLPKFGTTNLQFVINTANLAPGTWDLTKGVLVKSSAWSWAQFAMTTSGTGVYTLALSDIVGTGKPLAQSGLLKSGNAPEFIFVFGGTAGKKDGTEYKLTDGTAATAGVTVATQAQGSTTWVPATISIAANKNSYITVP
jgi:hypothetical protein